MNETERKAFGEYLKRLRIAEKLSLRQVEKEVGISNSYLYQIERGERNAPKLDIMKKLATLYKVSFASLLAAARLEEPEDEDRYYTNIEQSIQNAFEMVRRDPDYAYGTQLNADDLSLEVKRFIVEMYEKSNNLKLLKDKDRGS
jgi:HTH-type transcriptional regulator, competence development regulator